MEFEKFYNETLMPEIKILEITRKKILENLYKNSLFAYIVNNYNKCFVIMFGTLLLAFLFLALNVCVLGFILMTFLIMEMFILLWYRIAKTNEKNKYKIKVKEAILKKYLDNFGRFTILYNEKPVHTDNTFVVHSLNNSLNKNDYTIKFDELIKLGFAHNGMIKNDDDVIYGSYNGHQVRLIDTHFCVQGKKTTHVVFKGLILKIYLKKSYLQKTLLMPKNFLCYNKMLNKIPNEYYDIYTDNETAAKRFFEDVYERLKIFERTFSYGRISYCLSDDFFYLMINDTKLDFFDFSDIDKSILNIEIHKRMFKELKAIFDLMDYLIENKFA